MSKRQWLILAATWPFLMIAIFLQTFHNNILRILGMIIFVMMFPLGALTLTLGGAIRKRQKARKKEQQASR